MFRNTRRADRTSGGCCPVVQSAPRRALIPRGAETTGGISGGGRHFPRPRSLLAALLIHVPGGTVRFVQAPVLLIQVPAGGVWCARHRHPEVLRRISSSAGMEEILRSTSG